MREAGLKVGLYYSLIDWSDPRYRTVYPEGMKKEDCLNDIYGSPAGKEEEPEKIEYDLMKVLPRDHWILWNIHIITLGRTICIARRPKCCECFLREECPGREA